MREGQVNQYVLLLFTLSFDNSADMTVYIVDSAEPTSCFFLCCNCRSLATTRDGK